MKKRPAPADTGLTLALNAAEGVLRIAVADADGGLLFSQGVDAFSRGAEVLAPSIRHALAILERRPEDIRRVAAVSGPGSFTGLRLTAATAAGLARAVGAKQAPLAYMDLLARQCLAALLDGTPCFSCGTPPHAPPGTALPGPRIPDHGAAHYGPGANALLCCLTRARRDLVFALCYACAPGHMPPYRAVTDLAVFSVSSGDIVRHILGAAADANAASIFLAGTGAHENRDTLASHFAPPKAPRVFFLNVTHPSPDTLMAAALDAPYTERDIEPLYARVSDAEENLPHIAARLGLNPSDAAAKLHAITHAMPETTGE